MVKKSTVSRWVRRHFRKHKCLCGCGEYIEIKPEHHKRGIPKYIKGHNFYGPHNPRTDEKVEEIRRSPIWDMLSEEEKQRRLGNLNMFGKMEEHPGWKGGRIVDDDGYIHLRMPEHPFAKDGYILEHRLVMENYLKENYPGSPYLHWCSGELCLKPEVVVHHCDENKGRNELCNLFPFPDQAAHIFWHSSSLPEETKIKLIKSGYYRTKNIKDLEDEKDLT